jgi:zinc D-Ala-D-Ala carboxypeptidase
MGDLSPHFSRREFDCHDGQIAHPTPLLVEALERLRAAVGRPCHIVSGYRDPAYNKAIGGAPDSRHIHNDAADLETGYATVAQAEEAGFTGIGYAGRWAVHVDTRPGPRVVFRDT